VDRKRLIAGGGLLVFLMILFVSGASFLNEWRSKPGEVANRAPLPGLGYCSAQQSRPCILSFQLHPGGGMVMNILARGYSQEFYVKVRQAQQEYIYECKKTERYSIQVTCTGETLPVGEALSFRIISSAENTTLAEGSFPVIGLALATPEVYLTPTYVPAFDRPPK
jgi:hypothetical protein